VKDELFTHVFFFLIIMLVKYVSIDGILQAFVFFRFVDIIVITIHDRFWNAGQANCILKYFENMMIDHSDSTIF
jgi:glycerol-3-phosphate acyltransferase PlsY